MFVLNFSLVLFIKHLFLCVFIWIFVIKKMDKIECQNHRMVHLEHQTGWPNFSLTQNKSCLVLPWPCCKIGHGQPTVIIWTNYDGVQPPMLHTKPPGHWHFGSREEGFWNFYHISAWWPSYSCDPDPTNKLLFPHPTEALMKFGFDRRGCFGEDLWK